MGDVSLHNFEFWIFSFEWSNTDIAPLPRLHCLKTQRAWSREHRETTKTLRTFFWHGSVFRLRLRLRPDTSLCELRPHKTPRQVYTVFLFFAWEIKNLIYPALQFAWRRKKYILLTPRLNTLKGFCFAEFNRAPIAGCPLRYHKQISQISNGGRWSVC